MKMRSGLLLATFIVCAAASTELRADVSFFTGSPGDDSTPATPFTVNINNGLGVFFTVNVTNISKLDDANQKATKIRAAINMAFPVKFPATGVMNQVTIGKTNNVRISADPTKEKFDNLGDGVEYLALFGGSGTATGLDPSSSASSVQMGIDGVYVAQVSPSAGQTAASILSQLASLLNTNGIPATFDSINGQVVLNDVVSQNELFVFGNSDTGFSSFAEVRGALDNFQCWKAKDLKTPQFAKTTVSVTDAFGASSTPTDLKKPFLLCDSASINGSTITNPAARLSCYKVKGASITSNHAVTDPFGSINVSINKVFVMCVPATAP